MSGSYSRLAAIRDYWMPRDPDARAEVRVTDIDEILRELVRLAKQRDALLEALKEVILDVEHEESDGYMSWLVSVGAHRLAQAAIKLVRGEKE